MARRRIIQLISAVAMNANLGGFLTGKIYQGQLKRLCVPGLNCYSCPAAVGSCPLGSLQFAIASAALPALAYVCGLLILFGALLGRFICGFLCPFGLFQELINAVFKGSRPLRLKNANYIMLIGFVIALPFFGWLATGLGDPAFCKYLCPAGTLAGLPLLAANAPLRSALGALFAWKSQLLVFVIIACALAHRPFCRVCPLGAIYGLFNSSAVIGMRVNEKCTHCSRCDAVCPVQTRCSSRECIRCGKCAGACHAKAIEYTVMGKAR